MAEAILKKLFLTRCGLVQSYDYERTNVSANMSDALREELELLTKIWTEILDRPSLAPFDAREPQTVCSNLLAGQISGESFVNGIAEQMVENYW